MKRIEDIPDFVLGLIYIAAWLVLFIGYAGGAR